MDSNNKRQRQDTMSSVSVVEWDSDSETEKPSLCCLQGCISATAVGISFFLGLPTGILLVVQASNSGNDVTLLSIGIVLIVLPIIILIIVLLLCFNQKRLPNLVFWKKKTPTRPVATTTPSANQSKAPGKNKRGDNHRVNNNLNHCKNHENNHHQINEDNNYNNHDKTHDNGGMITYSTHHPPPPPKPQQLKPLTIPSLSSTVVLNGCPTLVNHYHNNNHNHNDNNHNNNNNNHNQNHHNDNNHNHHLHNATTQRHNNHHYTQSNISTQTQQTTTIPLDSNNSCSIDS